MVEFLLCVFLGYFGIHKFYKKNWKMGLLYFFTFGLFGIGWVSDILRLGIELVKRQIAAAEYQPQKRMERIANSGKIADAESDMEQAFMEMQAMMGQESMGYDDMDYNRSGHLEGNSVARCPRCMVRQSSMWRKCSR